MAAKTMLSVGVSLLIAAGSCGAGAGQEVVFNRAQPLGQKSSYVLKNNAKTRLSSESPAMELTMETAFETDVTAVQPNGNWTMSTRFTKVDVKINGESQPDAASPLAGKTFAMTMDKDGKLVEMTGGDNILPGMDLKEMMSQMNPAAMLPTRPIRVGESWPVEINNDVSMPGGNLRQTVKGNGTLQSVSGTQAAVDLDLTFETTMAGNEAMSMSGSGTGKTSMTYDLDKARVVSNKTDLTMDMTGEVRVGGKSQTMKSSVSTSVQLNLIVK